MLLLESSDLQSVCKNESSAQPCPRLVLVCCTALVTRGLETEGLFLEEAPLELVQSLLGSFQEGKGLSLCMHLQYSPVAHALQLARLLL